jgi:hypothetical protein
MRDVHGIALGVVVALAGACGDAERARSPGAETAAAGTSSGEASSAAGAAAGGSTGATGGADADNGGQGSAGDRNLAGAIGDVSDHSGGDGGDGGDGGGAVLPGQLRFDLPVDDLPLPGGFVLTADLTGDGRREALYLDPWSIAGSLRVVFAVAQPDGSFTEMPAIVVGASSAVPVYGDFNGDERLDVGLPDRDQNGHSVFRVFLGNGDGTFLAPLPGPSGIAADFDDDGRTDALEVGGTNVPSSRIWLAQPDASFVEHAVPFVSNAFSKRVGDFDGDGHLDIALDLAVRRGFGDGTFGPLLPVTCSSCATGLGLEYVADLNDDGRSDLVVGYPFELVVLLGQADGSLAEASRHSLRSAAQMVTGHLDGDGQVDLAVTTGGYRLELLFGDGAGSFSERRSYENTRTTYASLFIEDRDDDGVGDVVLDGRWVAYGRGQRRVRAPEYSEYTPAGPNAPAIVDRENDGVLDVASVFSDARLHFLPFGPDRYLRTGEVCTGPGSGSSRHVADLTGDGFADVASFSGDLSLWVGQGGCNFAAATPHPYGGILSWFLRINDDALADVVYWTNGGFGVALATAPGVFGPPVMSPFSRWPMSLVAADFNGDEQLDVVTANHDDGVITVLFGRDLVLTEVDTLALGVGEKPYLQAADIDDDGDVDVLMGVDTYPSHIAILRNDGQGSLAREWLADADTLAGYRVADVDSDGSLELVVDHDQQTIAIYRVGPTGPAVRLTELAMRRGAELRDVDGDGDLDLVSKQAGFVGVANNLIFD